MQTMNAVPFDTLKLARGLEAAGLAAPVAAGTAAALAEAMGGADLATKADLAMLESRVIGAIGALDTKFENKFEAQDAKSDSRFEAQDAKLDGRFAAQDSKFDSKFGALETKLDSRFAAVDAKLELLRRDMTIKLGGMIFIATGVILAALRIMPHP
jgi:hypothetical protein